MPGLKELGYTTDVDAIQRIEALERLLAAQLSFGVPIDLNSSGAEVGQKLGNIRGAWVEVTLTAAVGTCAVAHNLNIPVSTVVGATSTANRLNVRWFVVGLEFGSRTGAVAQPAAPAAVHGTNFIHMLSSAVTADSFTLQFSANGFVPTATTPLFVSFFVIPATR